MLRRCRLSSRSGSNGVALLARDVAHALEHQVARLGMQRRAARRARRPRTGACDRRAWRRCRRTRRRRRRSRTRRQLGGDALGIVTDVAGPGQAEAARGEQLDHLRQVLVGALAREDLVADDDQAEVHGRVRASGRGVPARRAAVRRRRGSTAAAGSAAAQRLERGQQVVGEPERRRRRRRGCRSRSRRGPGAARRRARARRRPRAASARHRGSRRPRPCRAAASDARAGARRRSSATGVLGEHVEREHAVGEPAPDQRRHDEHERRNEPERDAGDQGAAARPACSRATRPGPARGSPPGGRSQVREAARWRRGATSAGVISRATQSSDGDDERRHRERDDDERRERRRAGRRSRPNGANRKRSPRTTQCVDRRAHRRPRSAARTASRAAPPRPNATTQRHERKRDHPGCRQ